MKKIITLLLIVLITSCTKTSITVSSDPCYECTWNPDQTGYIRPKFTICGKGDWMSLADFKDENHNWIGGHCTKK